MKVTYTSYTAVAEWKWDLPAEADDTCGICRVQFEGTCAKCKYPGEDCPIIIGACTHCFHMHCISDWIASEASQGKCPMCRQVFKEKIANAPASPQVRTPEARVTRAQAAGSAGATG
ncbi:ubiquitin-protein ligase Anaphase Promoting Complex [Saxophila tyrrhenica]|uniref:Anaphase-promoting complex subunit 11 n=1 Tax=Saxophila tyrrhenica TaxID=1690608 RepID=A0AAV9NU73_9PEZI|nr:ubiquitin-protein ligase Anaphase Promoting Complex [Saxophila tyrrhenica]